MRGKYLNDPTLFLHFGDYPPFEEELGLHLNKLKFLSCKNEIGKMFHLKRFNPIYKCKNSFSPLCPPP
jgi:hypothetical protein